MALEITLTNGSKDLIISVDSKNPLGARPDWRTHKKTHQPDWDVKTDAEFLWLRRSPDGRALSFTGPHTP